MVQIHSPRPLFSVEVPHCVRDFACGLRCPQNGSSSNPFAPTTPNFLPFISLRDFLRFDWCGVFWTNFRGGVGTDAYRDIKTGRPASYRTVRVTPPNTHSLNWEWP
jgi:hypothetical protein